MSIESDLIHAITAAETWQAQRETFIKMIARYNNDIEKIKQRSDIDQDKKNTWSQAPKIKADALFLGIKAADAVMEFQRLEIERLKTKIVPSRHRAEYIQKLELFARSKNVNVNYLTLKDFQK